jgi:hypothetical protein
MRVVVITPLMVTLSIVSVPLPGSQAGYAFLERYISYGVDQAECAVEGIR